MKKNKSYLYNATYKGGLMKIKDLSERYKTIQSLEYNAGEYLCELGAEDLKKNIKHKIKL